jgi:transcriptional regulator with XRE-family HTH domain
MNRFPEKLRELRVAKRMSQAELADMLGITKNAVSLWERGATSPTMDKLTELSRFFNLPLSQLTDTPGEDVSIDMALKTLPDDMQMMLRQSFMDTINAMRTHRKP